VTGTKQLPRSTLQTRRKNRWPFVAAQTAGKSGNDGPIVSLIGYWLGATVRNKCFVLGRRHQLTFALAIALTLAGSTLPLPADAAVQDVKPVKPSRRVVPIKFWNRVIVLQRATLAGADPEDRKSLNKACGCKDGDGGGRLELKEPEEGRRASHGRS